MSVRLDHEPKIAADLARAAFNELVREMATDGFVARPSKGQLRSAHGVRQLGAAEAEKRPVPSLAIPGTG